MHTKTQRSWVIFFTFLSLCVIYTQSKPQSLDWAWYYKVVEQAATNIYNMTMIMYKNMDMKYRHAELLTELHSDSMDFMMGSISSAVRSKFKEMLSIYRKHSDFNKIAGGTPSVWDYTVAYAELDSAYNEIRVMRELYWDMVKSQDNNEKQRKNKELDDLKKNVFEEFGINITSADIDPDKFRLYKAYADLVAKRDKKMIRGLKPPPVKGFSYLVKKFQKQEQERMKKTKDKKNDGPNRNRRLNPHRRPTIPIRRSVKHS